MPLIKQCGNLRVSSEYSKYTHKGPDIYYMYASMHMYPCMYICDLILENCRCTHNFQIPIFLLSAKTDEWTDQVTAFQFKPSRRYSTG